MKRLQWLLMSLALTSVFALAQDLSQFSTGVVTNVTVQKDPDGVTRAINVAVKVTDKDGKSFTWDHFLSADEMTLWNSGAAGQDSIAKKSMLTAWNQAHPPAPAAVVITTSSPRVSVSMDQTQAQAFVTNYQSKKALFEADIATLKSQLTAKEAALVRLIQENQP